MFCYNGSFLVVVDARRAHQFFVTTDLVEIGWVLYSMRASVPIHGNNDHHTGEL